MEAVKKQLEFPPICAGPVGMLRRCLSFALLEIWVGWKKTVAFGVWQNLSNYFSNTLGLAKADSIFPNAFSLTLGPSVSQEKCNPYASDLLILKSSNYCLETVH